MRMKLAVVTVAMLAGAMPAAAQSTFFDVCGTASMTSTFKVCASAEVFLNAAGTELNVRVWNRNQTTTPVTSVVGEYTSQWGGWHTITAIGIENIVYTGATAYTSQARWYHTGGARIDASGNRYDVLSQWGADSDANSIQVVNTGADVNNGHKEGIVGCRDPGPTSANHVVTCNTYPGTPYAQFVLSGFQSINLAGAYFTFHSQQVALSTCSATKLGANQCTEDSAKGTGPGNPPPPTEVVPEPITMFLMGTGLAGVGAVRRRRRAQELEQHV